MSAPPHLTAPPLPAPAPEEPSRADDASLLRAYLAARDQPCPRCWYNLRDLTGSRCPECGDELRLQVGLVEPRLAAYLVALSFACLGLGASALLGMVALLDAPASWWGQACAFALIGLFVASAAATSVLLRKRLVFRRLSREAQWGWAMSLAGLVGVLGFMIVAWFDG